MWGGALGEFARQRAQPRGSWAFAVEPRATTVNSRTSAVSAGTLRVVLFGTQAARSSVLWKSSNLSVSQDFISLRDTWKRSQAAFCFLCEREPRHCAPPGSHRKAGAPPPQPPGPPQGTLVAPSRAPSVRECGHQLPN